MIKTRALGIGVLGTLSLLMGGCAANLPNPKDYTAFHKASPHSILIVPVINHSNETQAADIFLTTMAVPLAERGYYVFPTNMSKKLIENDGLADPGLVHGAPTQSIAKLFNADSVFYVEVLNWKAKYAITASVINVKFLYTLKSGKTGELLWQEEKEYQYSTSANSGNIFADLIANAVKSMIDNGRADYSPVAIQANALALFPAGQGLPFGPHNKNNVQNEKLFPATGSGKLSNATTSAVAYPVKPEAH
jgi:hypothetical protein